MDVPGEVQVRVPGRAGGPSLDARVNTPPGAERAVVICHPHPLYGGSMHSPVPLALARCLSDRARGRVAWARFDFRGVGASEGTYDDGRGELDDARAVIDEVCRRAPEVPVSLCGHSFGSWIALRAASSDRRVDRVLLIAPSRRFFDYGRKGAPNAEPLAVPVTIFIGDGDHLSTVDDARALADDLGANLRIFERYDHHFMKSRRAMAEAALPVIVPEALPQ